MELPEPVRAFLDAPRFAVLATVRPDGTPHLTVVWCERRGDEVIVNTTLPRSKARNLATDPRVSLLVGCVSTTLGVWWGYPFVARILGSL